MTSPDEFELRMRALEAERLRPVPKPPTTDFERKLDEFEHRLQQFGAQFYGDNDDKGTD